MMTYQLITALSGRKATRPPHRPQHVCAAAGHATDCGKCAGKMPLPTPVLAVRLCRITRWCQMLWQDSLLKDCLRHSFRSRHARHTDGSSMSPTLTTLAATGPVFF